MSLSDYKPSPFTPKSFPELAPIAGAELAVVASGSRYQGRDDLLVMRFCEGTVAAGVFTQSSTASCCVASCRQALATDDARLLIVNAGNANACTGEHGIAATAALCREAAAVFHVPVEGVFHCSTGVIGVRMDEKALTAPMPDMCAGMTQSESYERAARAIMTTDTFPKGACVTVDINGTPVTLSGFAKGSGMIAPDMATMLGFIVTDAVIDKQILQEIFADSCEKTYNAITVDGDTSTNDTSLIFATGKAGNTRITDISGPAAKRLAGAIHDINAQLALLIVGDGEGITKRLDITVSGAENAKDARVIAMAIGNSPLVKSAFFGADPNWGRLMMAIGKSGVKLNLSDIRITVCGVDTALDGEAVADVDLSALSDAIKAAIIVPIDISIGAGNGTYTAYSTDLSYEYVRINAEYTS